jgi:hypothetical protein
MADDAISACRRFSVVASRKFLLDLWLVLLALFVFGESDWEHRESKAGTQDGARSVE